MGQPVMMAVSVGTTLLSAKMQKDAYEMEAQQNEEQAEMAKIEADQQANVRRNQLLQMLSSLNVSESSRGLDIGSGGTSSALRGSEKKMADKLANELLDASDGRGEAVKKRQDTHKMADANKAFSHFRF